MRTLRIMFITTISVILFFGCEKMFNEQTANNPEAIFENLWTSFNEEYALFEERNVDWDSLYEVYRPMISYNTSDDELFRILSELLVPLDDGHVSLTAPGKEVFFSNKYRRELIGDELFSISLIKNYLEEGYKSGDEDSYIYGKIKYENIAYIFFDYVGENFSTLNNFLAEYNHLEGFIIDLRHNKGGDFTYSFSEIGRFTDQSRFVFRSKTKNGEGKNDFTPWHEWYIKPKGEYVSKQIVVITDRFTISAGERAVMAFKILPNVTVLGDTTNGAHGTMIGRELANGWFYSLVPQKTELFDGKSYEGIGLAPDIFIKNTPEDIIAGSDKVLELAIDTFQ
jgi:carboxyl-terminal processing protease